MSSENILNVAGLKVAYGGIKAVKGIDLQVNRGELVTLIGANGAGKTTTLKAITGTLPPCKVEGTIRYQGQPLASGKSFKLVQQKLAMVPEGRGVFANDEYAAAPTGRREHFAGITLGRAVDDQWLQRAATPAGQVAEAEAVFDVNAR